MKKATAGSIILLLVSLSLQVVHITLALPLSESNRDLEQSETASTINACLQPPIALNAGIQDLCISAFSSQAFDSEIHLETEDPSRANKKLLPWKAEEHVHEVHCSRERSRAAWNIIEEHLMPFVERENYQMSTECLLHPNNDLFRDQEQHKIHLDINDWQCGYCKKSFRAEKFLDQHFDNRHHNLLNVSHGKCLADLCGALHCDLKMDVKLRKSKCNPAAAARNRHLCESLADRCFPINEGPSASRLHELVLHQFCEAHSCSGKQKPFSRGVKRQAGVFYLAVSILTLMLLPIFYVIVYLHHRESRNGIQVLRRISKAGRKTKPL